MSVRPITFNVDGSIDAVYEEQGHSGTVPAAQVTWVQNTDGTDNHNYIGLPCPDGCGASSTWPVSGGADALAGQQMFVLKEMQPGLGREALTLEQAAAEVKARVIAMDGEERWVLDDAAMAALEEVQHA